MNWKNKCSNISVPKFVRNENLASSNECSEHMFPSNHIPNIPSPQHTLKNKCSTIYSCFNSIFVVLGAANTSVKELIVISCPY